MLEYIPSILPLHSFDTSIDLNYADLSKSISSFKRDKKYLLPSLNKYLNEKEKIKAYLAWDESGVLFSMEIDTDNNEVFYPDFRRGNSVEIFIDTRNLKNTGYITKFCHQFVIFPQKINGFHVMEVTRFINEDMHVIADPSLFDIDMKVKEGKGYSFTLKIPAKALYGYDISKMDKIGFTYRINRKRLNSISFVSSPIEFKIERYPSFWATGRLKKIR